MNDFVFSSSFNLANMTCQLVELGSINPLKPISTSWNIEIAKLKLLSLRLGCFLASLQYPSIYKAEIVWKLKKYPMKTQLLLQKNLHSIVNRLWFTYFNTGIRFNTVRYFSMKGLGNLLLFLAFVVNSHDFFLDDSNKYPCKSCILCSIY